MKKLKEAYMLEFIFKDLKVLSKEKILVNSIFS